MAALGSVPVPNFGAEAFFVVKNRCLCDIDEIGEQRCDTPDDGYQNPSLSRIE
jgi:hypothetical protein